ncbi:M50 family peptidase, partial [Citrobacter sp. TBCS-11]
YPSPLLFSGLFVWFLRLNYPEFVLFVLLFVSISVLFVIRNWYGVLICLLGVILTGSLIYFGQSEVFTGIAGM